MNLQKFLLYFIERVVLYKTGLISSNITTFPVPTYILTVIFGLTLGVCFGLLYSVIGEREYLVKSGIKICVLINEVRTEHFTYLTKEEWKETTKPSA